MKDKISSTLTDILLAILLFFSGCDQRKEHSANGPIVIREQGSFAIGGKVLTHPGTFNPADNFKPNGQSFHGDHAYVFYQIPENAWILPIVFAHGLGQFSKTGETTPDRCEGFQSLCLRRGFSTYLPDQPRRGNASRSTEAATITSTFDEQTWFNRFRLGIWPDYFEGAQFNKSEETLNQYFRQMVPTVGSLDFEVYSDAYAFLFNKIGLAIFITHSLGGPVGWKTLLKTTHIKAIVAYEPGGDLPFPEGQSYAPARTLTRNFETIEIPMSDFMVYTKIPILIYYGDFLPETDERPELYKWIHRLHLARDWAKVINVMEEMQKLFICRRQAYMETLTSRSPT